MSRDADRFRMGLRCILNRSRVFGSLFANA